MKISRIDVYKFSISLTHEIVVPIGVLKDANNVAIRISTDTGIEGWGEASPFAPITGDTQDSNYVNARLFALTIMGKDPLAVEARMAEIESAIVGEPSLRAAFDMALYDILGKAANLPLYRLLGGEKRHMCTDFTIGIQESVSLTLERLDEGLEQGFREVKLKVGRPGLADVEHIAAVREKVGPSMAIKIDSNQGWDFPTAVANLTTVQKYDIQYSEQPLAAWDFVNLKRLRERVNIPICADESVFDHKDAMKLVSMGAVDYLNIKLGKSGGISTALRIEAVAESAGNKCMIGCFAESRLGLSAAAHLACARPNIVFLDLDSGFNLKSDPVEGGMIYNGENGGGITLPETPGIGACISEKHLEDYAHYSVTG
jgi:L-alanine-DL-glutamate epimerase-like enolase superfamily enzyme